MTFQDIETKNRVKVKNSIPLLTKISKLSSSKFRVLRLLKIYYDLDYFVD